MPQQPSNYDRGRPFYPGRIVTLNRLQDSTRTVEIALDKGPFPFALGVAVRIFLDPAPETP